MSDLEMEVCLDGFHSDECPGCGMRAEDRDDPMIATCAAMNFGDGATEARAAVLRELREEVAGMAIIGSGDTVYRAAVLAAIDRRLGDD